MRHISYCWLLTGSHLHSDEGFLQPLHTPFSIFRPQALQGVHPHVWHMAVLLYLPGGLTDFTNHRHPDGKPRAGCTIFGPLDLIGTVGEDASLNQRA